MKRIIITEKQLNYILNEGVSFNRTPNGSFDFSVTNDRTDKANNMLDTRFFRNASDILYKGGDETKPTGLHKQVDNQRAIIETYGQILDYLETNKDNPQIAANIYKDLSRVVPQADLDYIVSRIKAAGVEDVMQFCWKKIRDNKQRLNMADNLRTRAGVNYKNYRDNYTDSDKMAQYSIGKVPDTNVDVIALFSMDGFNVSDILKNGNLRYSEDIRLMMFGKDAENEVNGYTESDWDRILQNRSKYKGRTWASMTPDEKRRAIDNEIKVIAKNRVPKVQDIGKKGAGEYQRLPVTYDNGTQPNILNNFSLPNDFETNKSHFRDDSNYSSVSKFIDKSIMCANYALNEIGYRPDFIVSAPSSSKFNLYYCTRLSQKLGIPYLNGFFKRNLINITYDEITEQKLNAAKATEADKEKIKQVIKQAVYAEITSEIVEIVKKFVSENYAVLSTIPAERYSRQKVNMPFLTKVILHGVYNDLMATPVDANGIEKNNVYRSIARKMLEFESEYSSFRKNSNQAYLMQSFAKLVKMKIGMRKYADYLVMPISNIIQKNSDKIDAGFTINTKKFKIVDIDPRFRKCIGNVYIISDEYLRKYGNDLQKQYMNSNFLIFDEDIDTGATLKIVVDLLQDKIDMGDGQIKCLTNGYKREYTYE